MADAEPPSGQDELIEAMAAIAYGPEGGVFCPAYDQLEEDEKDEYRDRVREYLPAIVEFVTDWIHDNVCDEVRRRELSTDAMSVCAAWREEMT